MGRLSGFSYRELIFHNSFLRVFWASVVCFWLSNPPFSVCSESSVRKKLLTFQPASLRVLCGLCERNAFDFSTRFSPRPLRALWEKSFWLSNPPSSVCSESSVRKKILTLLLLRSKYKHSDILGFYKKRIRENPRQKKPNKHRKPQEGSDWSSPSKTDTSVKGQP